MKIAKLQINLKDSKGYRESICAWLHAKAEEIKNINDEEYIDKPNWSFHDNGQEE